MKKISTFALGLMLASAAFAQKTNNATEIPTFQETMGKYFLVGAAVNTSLTDGQDPAGEEVVKKQFNQVVAENCMKGEENHPEVNRFDFTDGDKLADWAEKNGKTLIGHCLVWHSQPPKWMFTDDKGNLVSREVLIGRMYNHIMNVVTHYKGRVKGWDVVNEAFEDDGSYRKSLYYKIIGPEFIELAFRFAHEADPNVELYYNDYSTSKPAKREAICKLVRDLKAKGLRIDAVGMQSHNGFDYPDYAEYEKSIEAFAGEGVKVMLTELDMNMLPNPEGIPSVALSWGNGSAIHLNAFSLGFCYQHLVASYQGICYMLIISAAAADVVGSLKDDELIHACLSQDVTVETLHGWFAQSALHHAVAADTEIQHTVWLLCIQGIREEIGPTVLMVGSTSTAIGDRVSEDSHHRGSLIGLHINS